MSISAAALRGINNNGHAWKARLEITLPENVPSIFKVCTTNLQIVTAGHNIAKPLLDSIRKQIPKIPPKSKDELLDILDTLESVFVYEDVTKLQEWGDDSWSEIAEGLQDELINQLDNLYDWVDYHRVLLVV